jgi:hypothetical protein
VVLARLFSNTAPSPLNRALSAYGTLGSQVPFDRQPLRWGKRAVRLNDNQLTSIIEAYKAGETTYQLAIRFGANRRTIAEQLKHQGVRLRRQTPTDAMVADIIRLYVAGLSAARVSERVGFAPDTVLNHLRMNGIDRRAPGRPQRQPDSDCMPELK